MKRLVLMFHMGSATRASIAVMEYPCGTCSERTPSLGAARIFRVGLILTAGLFG